MICKACNTLHTYDCEDYCSLCLIEGEYPHTYSPANSTVEALELVAEGFLPEGQREVGRREREEAALARYRRAVRRGEPRELVSTP